MSHRRAKKTPERRAAILARQTNKPKLRLYSPRFAIGDIVSFTNDPEKNHPKKRGVRNFKQRKVLQVSTEKRYVMVEGCTSWVPTHQLVRVPKRKTRKAKA